MKRHVDLPCIFHAEHSPHAKKKLNKKETVFGKYFTSSIIVLGKVTFKSNALQNCVTP